MARRYYDTSQRVFQLFKNHPALSQMYTEFGVETDGIKRVAEFLVLNHDKIDAYDLQDIYKSKTPLTFEPDQNDPIKGTVETFAQLPTNGISKDDIWYITDPGKYYYWNGSDWKEDLASIDVSRSAYLTSLYQEHGYKVWEEESGTFVAIEGDDSIIWEKIDVDNYDFSVIRKSNLPSSPSPGDVYKVSGEDLIDIVSSLYGFVDMGMTIPWDQYVSSKQTNLQQLLNMTIYLYRYGVTDNFYENNIWQFLPEYDRDIMLAQPKMKLFMESMGRKLDQLEDKLTRLEDVYDIDETPSDLLDHLGQMLGYEKEDFSLSDVSFRELLKNIIEIYKIKGTNYSFSFFFKFLGFNVDLKEFYFNRDVKNPEAFPGMDELNVEYYLTTTNPIMETYWGNPAPHLNAIRSLDDWKLEYNSLEEFGCTNSINYMLGKEAHSKDGITMHSNPWVAFKTNLIEYELNPFFDKVSLTSSDNETILKYIKFLSPTYLFTWINVNLAPWIENITVSDVDVSTYITQEIGKTFGTTVDGKFNDWEEIEDALQVWDDKENKFISYKKADQMGMSIVNNLNLGGDEQVGAKLKHDGVYIRQPGHPSHITGIKHNGATRLNFDNLGIMIKHTGNKTEDITYQLLADRSDTEHEGTIAFVEETGLYYIYKDPAPFWSLIEDFNGIIDDSFVYSSYKTLTAKGASVLTEGEIYHLSDDDTYYSYRKGDSNNWITMSKDEVISNITEEASVEDFKNPVLGDMVYITNNDYYRYNSSYWELILDPKEISILINTRHQYTSFSQLLAITPPVKNEIYKVSATNRVYQYIDEDAYWEQAYDSDDRYTNWMDYSYRPYPSYPMNVKPSPGIVLSSNNVDFIWDEIESQNGYWIQLSNSSSFENILFEYFISNDVNSIRNILMDNDNYYWKIRTKNSIDINEWTLEEIDNIAINYPEVLNYFIKTDIYTLKDISSIELNRLIEILSVSGSRFNWGRWSSTNRFKVSATLFPRNNQVIDNINYQFLDKRYNIDTNEIIKTYIKLGWDIEVNAEKYELMVSRTEDFSILSCAEVLSVNTFSISVTNGMYYWKYRTKKTNEEYGEYSDIMKFEIDV